MLDKLTHHMELEFHVCQLWTLQHEVISKLLGRSLEHQSHFYVVIDHATTCFFTLANKIQPSEEPISKVHSVCRLIIHNSFQQTHFSRCCVRFVLPVQQSPHLESVQFLRMMSDATQSLSTDQSPAVLSRLSWPRPSLVV